MTDDQHIDGFFRDKLKKRSEIPSSIKWNKEDGWKKLEKSIPKKRILRNNWVKIAVAASIMFISFLSGLYIQKTLSSRSQLSLEANQAIKEIKLPGGHKCTLAPFSKILFSRASSEKSPDTLFVDGEAFVQTNNSLIIKAKNTISLCNNASVNIRSFVSENKVTISNFSGKVSGFCTENNFPAIAVEPNEQYAVFEGGIIGFKNQIKDPNLLAWKTGKLIFNNESLEYVVNVLEDYYGVNIEINHDELKSCRINMQLSNQTLNEALQQLKNMAKFTLSKKGLLYIIEGQGC